MRIADAVGLLFRLRALVALAALVVVFSSLSPAFLTTANLTILVKHVAINAILAVGMTFVILSGGIDLSVGSIAGLAGMIAGGLIHNGLVLHPSAWWCTSRSGWWSRSRCWPARWWAASTACWCPGSTWRRSSPPWAPCTWRAARPC